MACSRHGEDCSANEAEEDCAESSGGELEALLEDGDVCCPEAEACAVDQE